MNPRLRSTLFALGAIAWVWLLAIGGHQVFKSSMMTAQKLRAFIEERDFSKLTGEARAKALRDLEAKINALSAEERQKARLARMWDRWFAEMTEEEKSGFIEATLPSGFKQMETSFEQMPPERRQRTVDNAIKRLREVRDTAAEDRSLTSAQKDTNAPGFGPQGTNTPPVVSEELQKQVAMIGIRTVYGSGSAQTKAELAPLLEELQRNLETGRMFHGGGR